MYYAKHTQSDDFTAPYDDPWDALEIAEDCGWEDCETELRQVVESSVLAEFACVEGYSHEGVWYHCEKFSNRPDSYCEVHAA